MARARDRGDPVPEAREIRQLVEGLARDDRPVSISASSRLLRRPSVCTGMASTGAPSRAARAASRSGGRGRGCRRPHHPRGSSEARLPPPRGRARWRAGKGRRGPVRDEGEDVTHGRGDLGGGEAMVQAALSARPSSSPGRLAAANRHWHWDWRSGSAAPSSTPIPCRSIANFASSPRDQPRGGGSGRRMPCTAFARRRTRKRGLVARARPSRPWRRRKRQVELPILCGGTGLYLASLTHGWPDPGRRARPPGRRRGR